MAKQAIRIRVAVALAGLLTVLVAAASALAAPTAPAAGQSYPAGTTFAGVCEVNPVVASYGGTVSVYQV